MREAAQRLVQSVRPTPFVLLEEGRNNLVFVSDSECISVPRDPTKTTYGVRVAAMRYLLANDIPTTRLVEHGYHAGMEYVITHKLLAKKIDIRVLECNERDHVLEERGRILAKLHRLHVQGFGRLNADLTGSHTSWRGFVEEYFWGSMKRLSKDRCLYSRYHSLLEEQYSEMSSVLDTPRTSFLHGDYHLGNLLFRGLDVVALMDLDIVMSGDIHWDLAHFLHTCKDTRPNAAEMFRSGYGVAMEDARMSFYGMIIWTRKTASQAESRREALPETLEELNRILQK